MSRRVSLADFTPDLPPEPDRSPSSPTAGGVRLLPIGDVATNPFNARAEADEDPEALQQLADTIAHRGVLQPIVVCGAQAFLEQHPDQSPALAGAAWVALIGNRRVAATRLAGADSIRAIVDVSALASIDEVMLIENGHRRDLAPLREAAALARLLDRDGLSVREVSRRIGRTHPYVVQRVSLLKLVPALQDALDAGTLRIERARELAQLPHDQQQPIADAGPPWRGGNAVTAPRSKARRLPTGDPAAAADTIRATYTGEQLAELVRLLTE